MKDLDVDFAFAAVEIRPLNRPVKGSHCGVREDNTKHSSPSIHKQELINRSSLCVHPSHHSGAPSSLSESSTPILQMYPKSTAGDLMWT